MNLDCKVYDANKKKVCICHTNIMIIVIPFDYFAIIFENNFPFQYLWLASLLSTGRIFSWCFRWWDSGLLNFFVKLGSEREYEWKEFAIGSNHPHLTFL